MIRAKIIQIFPVVKNGETYVFALDNAGGIWKGKQSFDRGWVWLPINPPEELPAIPNLYP